MSQFEMLWAYQQEDMKADRIATDIRRSPVRQKMEKCRNQVNEYKKQYQEIEEKVSVMADRLDVILAALPRCEEQLAELGRRVQENPPADLETAKALSAEASRLKETIAGYENELKRITKDSKDNANRQNNLRHQVATIKQEFGRLKEEWEKEQEAKKTELDAQRAVAQSKAEGIEERFLAEYAAIKKHTTPPVSRLLNDQCSGCNTSLPSALLRQIKAGNDIVECETCGRMIIPV